MTKNKRKESSMKKQLGIIASLLFLCTTALMWVGCADNRTSNSAPVYEQPAPIYQTNQASEGVTSTSPVAAAKAFFASKFSSKQASSDVQCEPECKSPARCKHPSGSELVCKDGLIVTAHNPRICMLNDQYPLEFDVKACDDLCEANVTTTLPDGVTYIRSQPEGRVEGRKISWNFGSMSKGECRPAKIWLKCDIEGELCACFCATAVPVRFCSILCAKPVLTCKKSGPEQVAPGEPVEYAITVTNHGSCTAEDVVVTDNLPEGVEHVSCQKTLVYKLGSLEPCQSKTVNICTTAVKRGKFTNTAVVTACNADSVSCESTVCISCCQMECTKVGPKEQQIGKNADYQIIVMNTGDLPLTDVVIVDHAPPSTSIVTANGATISGNTATWRLREMKPGEKVSFNTTLTTCVAGCFTNKVDVTNCQNCNGHCESMTHWKGRPALNVSVAQTENPICIDDSTAYNIVVVNQGSEPDSNVQVVVTFPEEVQAIGVSGDASGQISGNTVKFASVKNVAARQTLRYRVDAKAKKSGDARVKFEVSSDAIKTPIVQQESTIVN
ncbi:Large cysteine-rich periplasmic protein OmcB|nr:Large cysteine-rich periplasmic protein OmcB [Neochlamydia sp. AcF84]